MPLQHNLRLGRGIIQGYLNDQDKEDNPNQEKRYHPLNMDRVRRYVKTATKGVHSDSQKGEEPYARDPYFHFTLD